MCLTSHLQVVLTCQEQTERVVRLDTGLLVNSSVVVGLQYALSQVTSGASGDRWGHWLEVTAMSQQADPLSELQTKLLVVKVWEFWGLFLLIP